MIMDFKHTQSIPMVQVQYCIYYDLICIDGMEWIIRIYKSSTEIKLVIPLYCSYIFFYYKKGKKVLGDTF